MQHVFSLFRKVFKELVKLSKYSNLAGDRLGIFAFLVLLLDVRENSSTEKATYKLLKEILTALNNKKVGGVFCDLHKALDCVNHKILLPKMELYGITGSFYNLIKSYIEHSYQKVKVVLI